MIEISKENYIGQGLHQKCYVHPENKFFCLKLKIKKKVIDPRVDREIQYYKKIKKKGTFDFLAQYHGKEITNLGIADVYDLIKDETTNEVSLSVYDYLKMKDSLFSDDLFVLEFEKLKEKLIKNKIIVRDLTAKNVCCKVLKDNSIKLIIIDGVGHRDFIPLVEYFSFFTRRKINKIFAVKKLHNMKEHRDLLLKKEIRDNRRLESLKKK